jgi:hypothetical protein
MDVNATLMIQMSFASINPLGRWQQSTSQDTWVQDTRLAVYAPEGVDLEAW